MKTTFQVDPREPDHYWRRTRAFMLFTTSFWAFFGFVIHFFVYPLNSFVVFGFPLGFYMAAQGSLIAFVVILFLVAHRQDAIDRRAGVAEPD